MIGFYEAIKVQNYFQFPLLTFLVYSFVLVFVFLMLNASETYQHKNIKSELIMRLAELNPHLYQRDIERIVSTIFEEVSQALARGDRVELRGFGAFSVKRRAARVARNPRTGAAVNVAEKHVPFFKTGKELRLSLNQESE